MHLEAFLFVEEHSGDVAHDAIVVECGSRNVNGSVRDLFPVAQYVGIDVEPGDGVDIVADFRKVATLEPADVVICTEVLEHDEDPASIVAKAYEILKPGGRFIMTCAGPGRGPHSKFGDPTPRPGEHYANVGKEELDGWLSVQGWSWWSIDVAGHDLRCIATR